MYKEKFKVITLCGADTFKDYFIKISEKLTLEGNIVLLPGTLGNTSLSVNSIKNSDIQNLVNDIHKAKIEMSDEIFVINPYGYISEEFVKREIEYAHELGKPVKYLWNPDYDCT